MVPSRSASYIPSGSRSHTLCPRIWYAWMSCVTLSMNVESSLAPLVARPPAGTTAVESVAPALIDGGGTNDWPGSAPASILEKTDCHETCTDLGSSFHAWYMSSMYGAELPLRKDSKGCGEPVALVESARSASGARADTAVRAAEAARDKARICS